MSPIMWLGKWKVPWNDLKFIEALLISRSWKIDFRCWRKTRKLKKITRESFFEQSQECLVNFSLLSIIIMKGSRNCLLLANFQHLFSFPNHAGPNRNICWAREQEQCHNFSWSLCVCVRTVSLLWPNIRSMLFALCPSPLTENVLTRFFHLENIISVVRDETE